MRVLVAEDDEGNRQLMAALCRSEGCTVAEAADGEEALRLFTEAEGAGRPFHLVVLDLAMPVMDGGTAARGMRAVEAGRRAWIEGYTGYPEHVESRESFTRAGIDHLTVKPGDPEGWRNLIRKLIRGTDEAN